MGPTSPWAAALTRGRRSPGLGRGGPGPGPRRGGAGRAAHGVSVSRSSLGPARGVDGRAGLQQNRSLEGFVYKMALENVPRCYKVVPMTEKCTCDLV